jgi:ribulose-5-phosphate 4-epimerase/fuculose-1-phosphate aldolase
MSDNEGPEPGPNEGIIKFTCSWQRRDCITADMIAELRPVRRLMRELDLIGVGEDGIGFGNLSRRLRIPGLGEGGPTGRATFVITGSQTGSLRDPGPEAYSYVYDWDIEGNRLGCAGLCRASSESLTHAVLYGLSEGIVSVLHVHSPRIWAEWRHAGLSTREEAAYGTPAMAEEMRRVFVENGSPASGAIRMSGHRDGIFAWGPSVDAVRKTVLGLG